MTIYFNKIFILFFCFILFFSKINLEAMLIFVAPKDGEVTKYFSANKKYLLKSISKIKDKKNKNEYDFNNYYTQGKFYKTGKIWNKLLYDYQIELYQIVYISDTGQSIITIHERPYDSNSEVIVLYQANGKKIKNYSIESLGLLKIIDTIHKTKGYPEADNGYLWLEGSIMMWGPNEEIIIKFPYDLILILDSITGNIININWAEKNNKINYWNDLLKYIDIKIKAKEYKEYKAELGTELI